MNCPDDWLCPLFNQSVQQNEQKHDEGFHVAIVVYFRTSDQDGMTDFEMGTIESLSDECGAELKTAIQAIITKHIGVRPS